MNLFTKRFGLVLASVVGVGAVAALAIGASFALFTSTTAAGTQTFTAGTVTLASTKTVSCTAVTTTSNLEPGDSGTCSFQATYGGSLPAYIGAEASVNGVLSPMLVLTINGNQFGGSTPVLIGNSHSDGGGPYTAKVDYTLTSWATNPYQGKSAKVTVTFYAVQCSNNGLGANGVLSTSSNEDCALPPASWTETPLSGPIGTGGLSVSTKLVSDPSVSGDVLLKLQANQSGTEESHATVTITWPDSDLLPASPNPSSDTSAVCTETTSSLTCTFTDFSHSIKSDTFTFALKRNLPSGTVVVAHTDVVTGSGTPPTGGEASDQATYTIP